MARQPVDIKIQEPSFPQYDERNSVDGRFAATAIESIHTLTPLNYAYFSPQNIQIIQNAIRFEVYQRSNGEYQISEQSPTELSIIMRSVYLQYGKNRPTEIPEQIAELNGIVVETCVPKIVQQIQQYQKYLQDITNSYSLMERPQYHNVHGEKSFNMARFI